jgi:hypothetical protein
MGPPRGQGGLVTNESSVAAVLWAADVSEGFRCVSTFLHRLARMSLLLQPFGAEANSLPFPSDARSPPSSNLSDCKLFF